MQHFDEPFKVKLNGMVRQLSFKPPEVVEDDLGILTAPPKELVNKIKVRIKYGSVGGRLGGANKENLAPGETAGTAVS